MTITAKLKDLTFSVKVIQRSMSCQNNPICRLGKKCRAKMKWKHMRFVYITVVSPSYLRIQRLHSDIS